MKHHTATQRSSLPTRILAIVLSLGIAMAPMPSLAQEAGAQSYAPPAEALEAAQKLADAFRRLAGQIPEYRYDVEALADHQDYDFEVAARYVTEKIAFDPYIGVMRGAAGTLNAGAGSAWDQALLLASLINTMAGEAQIVQGTLSHDDARRLLERSLDDPWVPEPPFEIDTAFEIFEDALPEESIARVRQGLRELEESEPADTPDVEAIADALLAELRKHGIEIPETDPEATEALVGELATHYAWVRYRESPADEWIEIHPAFGSSAAPTATVTAYHADEAPEDVQHFLEFRLEIERFDGKEYLREAIMAPYRKPVANLAERQLRLGIAPNQLESGNEPEFFFPILNDQLAPGAKAFTLAGVTAPAADALSGPAVLVTGSQKLNEAASALKSFEAGESVPETLNLVGVRMAVDWIVPGAAVQHEQRQIIDLRDLPIEDRALEVPFAAEVEIGIGRIRGFSSIAGVLQDQSRRSLTLPYLAALVDGEITLDDYVQLLGVYQTGIQNPWFEMAAHRSSFEGQRSIESGHFRPGPFVIMRRVSLNSRSRGLAKLVVDILHNPSRALRRIDGRIATSPADVLVQGVRETEVERRLVGLHGELAKLQVNPGFAVRSEDDLEALSRRASIEPAIKRLIAQDLADGNVLVAKQFRDRWFWWRIHEESGTTLGMQRWGGSAFAEYKKVLGFLSFFASSLMYFKSLEDCDDTYSSNQTMRDCCKLANTGLFSAGGLITAWGPGFLSQGNTWKSAMGIMLEQVSYEATMYAAGQGVEMTCREFAD